MPTGAPVAEHAYQHMRAELRRRADELDRILQRHGMSLERAVLDDDKRRSAHARGG